MKIQSEGIFWKSCFEDLIMKIRFEKFNFEFGTYKTLKVLSVRIKLLLNDLEILWYNNQRM